MESDSLLAPLDATLMPHFDATLDATLSNPDGSDVVSSCQFLLTSALQSALRRLEKTVLPLQPLVTWSWLQLLPMMWRCY